VANTILRLDADDVWSAVEIIDTVALPAEALIGRTIGHLGGHATAGRLEPWSHDGYVSGIQHSATLKPEAPRKSNPS
jgi:hypothetical protein